MSLQLCIPLYHVEEGIGTYEIKLLLVLTHDLFAAVDTQPPGEEIQRSMKKKARAEAGKRATTHFRSHQFLRHWWAGFRRQEFQPTDAGHGYQVSTQRNTALWQVR